MDQNDLFWRVLGGRGKSSCLRQRIKKPRQGSTGARKRSNGAIAIVFRKIIGTNSFKSFIKKTRMLQAARVWLCGLRAARCRRNGCEPTQDTREPASVLVRHACEQPVDRWAAWTNCDLKRLSFHCQQRVLWCSYKWYKWTTWMIHPAAKWS